MIPSSKVTLLNANPLNADDPFTVTVVSDFGIYTLLSPEPLNTGPYNVVRFGGNTIDVNALQL